jgi:hypothetical protein
MISKSIPCKAKNPAKCPYHGNLAKAEVAMKSGDWNTYNAARQKADRAALKTGEVSEFLGISNDELKKKTYGPSKNKSIAEHEIEAIVARTARKKQAEEAHLDALANRALIIAEAHGTMPERLKSVYGDDGFGPTAYSVGGSSPEMLKNHKTEAREMYQAAAEILLNSANPLFDQKIRDDETQADYEINWQDVSQELRASAKRQYDKSDNNLVLHSAPRYVNNAYAYTVKILQQNIDKNPHDLEAALKDLDSAYWEDSYAPLPDGEKDAAEKPAKKKTRR